VAPTWRTRFSPSALNFDEALEAAQKRRKKSFTREEKIERIKREAPDLRELAGRPVEIWFQDEARVGQQGTLTRIWAKRGTRPRTAALRAGQSISGPANSLHQKKK
jgi:hypothetical protein